MLGRLIVLKSHISQTVLRINRGTDLRKNPPLFQKNDFGFILKKDQGSKFSLQYLVITSRGLMGWVFADDVQEVT
jgi:hypothetical protein